MEGKAHILDARLGPKMKVLLEFDECDPASVNELLGHDIRIEMKRWREKRSLDSNAYAWVLMQKIAEKVHSDKMTVYMEMLQRYSGAFTHIIVKKRAVKAVMEMYRTAIDLGEISVGDQTGHQLQVYFGSSTFNTKEMSVFIDGLVSECKELGIETLPPYEIERMVSAWDSQAHS